MGHGHLVDDTLIPDRFETIGELLDWLSDEKQHLLWFVDDIAEAAADAEKYVGDAWKGLSDARQRVLAELAYQIGYPRLAKFRRMLVAIKNNDFDLAAKEGLASRWAAQTPQRARDLMGQFRKG